MQERVLSYCYRIIERIGSGAVLVTLMLISLLAITLATGCARKSEKPKPFNKKETSVSGAAITGKVGVLMLGRSVMAGWFQHWGSDTSSPVDREGFALYYSEIEGPPKIAASEASKVDEKSDKVKIVFFKFCFVDFEGGSREDAQHNLSRNKGYVEKVYQSVVKEHGKKLIVGNALPQVKKATDPDLVWNHRQYNQWLNEFAQGHTGEVYIFDQYGVLADSEGNLKKEYANDPEDSHPNGAGYSALDGPFFALLRTLKS